MRNPLCEAYAAGPVTIRSHNPIHKTSCPMGDDAPIAIRVSCASMVLGTVSNEYASPGNRTKSCTMKPTTANIAVRPCFISDSRNHGTNGSYVSLNFKGSNLNSLRNKLIAPGYVSNTDAFNSVLDRDCCNCCGANAETCDDASIKVVAMIDFIMVVINATDGWGLGDDATTAEGFLWWSR